MSRSTVKVTRDTNAFSTADTSRVRTNGMRPLQNNVQQQRTGPFCGCQGVLCNCVVRQFYAGGKISACCLAICKSLYFVFLFHLLTNKSIYSVYVHTVAFWNNAIRIRELVCDTRKMSDFAQSAVMKHRHSYCLDTKIPRVIASKSNSGSQICTWSISALGPDSITLFWSQTCSELEFGISRPI